MGVGCVGWGVVGVDLGWCPGCVLGWGVWILWSAGQLVGLWSADYLMEYIWCWLLTGLGLCCIVGVVIIRDHD